ncbi:restriction endonuclease subunit S [Tsukamurella sp. 1534]|uniref:restriction endonuclease subunit S n=1 Tax=Tsukamurella sp. 1534 TaxID=1151061 RepID=UPI0009D9889D|nr:restriction endonuclease subunit S [Tsukamurella sp. 1534]
MRWSVADVGDIAEVAIGPFGSSMKADEYVAEGVPVVAGGHLRDGRHPDLSSADMISAATADRLARSLLAPGDLVFPHRGAIGRVGLADRPMMMSTSMMRARFAPEVVDSSYAYWHFRGVANAELLTMASSVGTPGIGQPLASLRSVQFRYPPLPQQQRIAGVLNALDDQIVANRALLRSADELVRVRYSCLPHGRARLGDIAEEIRQKIAPADIAPDCGYVGLEHFDRRLVWLQEWGAGSDVSSTKSVFVDRDVLFGKLRPYFHKVSTAPGSGVCSTDILVIRAKDVRLSALVLSACASDEVVAMAVQNSNGTRMPRAKWVDIADFSVPDPGLEETKAFVDFVDAVRLRCLAAVRENAVLATARDELLPLLMDGRITVKEAEKRVEGVV